MNQDWKVYIPNVITYLRIVLSLLLFWVEPQTFAFILIYIICGVTDVCDGYLARRWNVSSKYGAFLDSIADLFFVFVLLVKYLPILEWKMWMFLWIGLIGIIRCLSILIGVFKYHTIAFIHTYGNKSAGLLLFFFPILLSVTGMTVTVIVICVVAIISAIEEMIIIISADSLDRDRKRL